ncbi:hypothetical protein BS47DRAFT_1343277, partial [Hydnum rufescens UP504]
APCLLRHPASGPTATTEDVKNAYRKESLRTHPDRAPNASPEEKRVLTEKFQAVADAYYVLSNPQRRGEYDALLRARSTTSDGSSSSSFSSTEPSASAAFFEQFKAYFSRPPPEAGTASSDIPTPGEAWGGGVRPDAQGVFADVERHVSWWSYIGALSGASLGFILANIPGAVAGGLTGSWLGAVRDAKGKPVMTVLRGSRAARKHRCILKAIALKVFGSLGSI